MERYDVLVVGGGPAGSSCAWKLQRGGLRVLVLDKANFPRDKTCAGWITPQVVEELELDVEDYSDGRVWQPIRGFRTGVIGAKEVHIPYERPVSYGIRRCEFDTYLLHRSGAECRLGEAIRGIERKDEEWVIDNRFRAPVLVGAGGHFCPVARILGARRSVEHSVVLAREVEFAADSSDLEAGTIEAETPEIFFCPDLKGYGWCFRKGNYLNIGLGRVDSDQLPKHVDEFCKFLKDRRKVRCEIPQRFHGHAYQLYERTPPVLFEDGVVLVGDSAGLAYPQSGEGIRPAIESGLIAAEVIRKAIRYDRDNLSEYQERILKRFGRPRSDLPIGWLPNAWLHSLAARILTTRSFARHVVLNRWFLHQHQPALFLEGKKAANSASTANPSAVGQ